MFIREMTGEECRGALASVGFGRLACARENRPYIVPVSFAVDGRYIYLFSMPGQKIEWMRSNPHVCLEMDSVKSRNDWTSVVAFGQYEELADTPESQSDRLHALEVLKRHAMWWQPGSVPAPSHDNSGDAAPVFFRIWVDRVTGYRGLPTP